MNPVPDTVGSHLVRLLEEAGIRAAFGIPGTHNLEFYRGLAAGGMRVVTTKHEQGAAYAADAFAKSTGEPALVVATSGPAVMNALVGVGTSYAESRPLVLIAPGRPSSLPRDSGELHELGDVFAAASAMTVWSHRLSSAREAPAVVAEAMRRTRGGRPRPVYLEVPLDLLDQPAMRDAALPHRSPATVVPDERGIAAGAEMINRARSPIIVAGGGAAHTTTLAQLAEQIAAPVVTTTNGKGVLAEHHPLSLGSSIASQSAMRAINESDTVLAIGTELAESDLGPRRVTAENLVRIDIDAAQLDRNARAEIALHGDAAEVIDRLLPLLDVADPDRASGGERRARTIRAAIRAELGAPHPFAAAIAAGLPRDAVVTADSSQVVYAGLAFELFCDSARRFAYMSRAATLGYAVPAAIGAAVADPTRPVVAVAGDGAFLFSCQELATIVDEGLAVTIVVIDNGGYAEIEEQERIRGIAPIGVRFSNPDFAAVGRAFGIESVTCGSPEALTRAVGEATKSDSPRLISVRVPA